MAIRIAPCLAPVPCTMGTQVSRCRTEWASPEATNNAAAQSALMIQAIMPRPAFLVQSPDLFGAPLTSLIVANVILVILNLPFAGVWWPLLRIPFRRLVPMLVVCRLIGVPSVQNSQFNVWLMLGFGTFNWVLLGLGLKLTPIVLGFILGPAFER